jgi:glycosyltransferase involved in cell wall biosynthesis
MKKIRILTARTYYSHWGKYAGIHQFESYLQKSKVYKFKELLIPMGEDWWKIPFGKKYILNKIKGKGVKPYKLNDFIGEVRLFLKSIVFRPDYILFYDAEHSLAFLPDFFNKCKFLKKPVIIGMYHQPFDIQQRILAPKSLKYPDKIIIMSPGQKKYFLENGRKEMDMVTIPLGVDTNFFNPASKTKKEKNTTFSLLTVGVWQRDYDIVFHVAKELLSEKVEFKIIAGNLKVPEELTNVTVYSNLSDEELRDMYLDSDVLFLPLKDATANHALLEGMASALPVITTNLDGTRFYLGEKNGLIIDSKDPGEFVKQILNLKNNESLRNELGSLARKRAEEISWEKTSETYGKYFSELLKAR